MDDMGFDHIFDEFDDAHADRYKFMAFFQEVLKDVALKFITESGEELFSSDEEVFPASVNLGNIFEETKGRGSDFTWGGGEGSMVAWVYVPILEGTLFCAVPGTESEQLLWETTLGTALRFSLVKLEEEKNVAESGQLQRQIDVLKQQHGKLVENNHRQYLQIQDKEKGYAKKLESEIAKQTAQLRKKNEELIEANRLKNEFLANMSHELRTPMNAIIGFSELLAETEMNSVQMDYAKTVKQSAFGLLSLINDILDFTKIEANKLDIEHRPFMLSDVVTNVCAMFDEPARTKGINFHCRLDERLPLEVIGDGSRLKQVLVNLSGNAMKFTEKGEIELRVDLARQEGDKLVLHFSVRDTGFGIAKDRQAAIFEEFVQEDGSTTRKFGGTGLGLAISAKLVALMGGRISLESEAGKGSIFSFSLTLSCAETPAKESISLEQSTSLPPSDSEVPSQPNVLGTDKPEEVAEKVVLLVEDNLVNQKLASVLIKRQGCGVVVAEDGLVALEKLKERRFDLIFMDLQMPNMGGLEATRRIREIEQSSESAQYQGLQDPEHPVLIVGLSAHARKEDAEEGLASGMNDFLTKPIVRAKLEAVLAMIDNA